MIHEGTMKNRGVTRVFSSILDSNCNSIAWNHRERVESGSLPIIVSGGSAVFCCKVEGETRDEIILNGIPTNISNCATSRDSSLLAASVIGRDSDVFLIDMASKCLRFRFQDHLSPISALCFSGDSKYLLSCDSVSNLYVFCVESGSVSGFVSLGTDTNISRMCTGGFWKDVKRRLTTNYLFAACGPSFIATLSFNPSSGAITMSECCPRIKRDFSACIFYADGDSIVAGSTSGDLIPVVFSRSGSWSVINSVAIPGSGGISALARSADFLIAGCRDGSVCLGKLNENGEPLICRRIHVDKNASISSISAYQSEIIVGTSYGSVYMIGTEKYEMKKVRQFPTSPIIAIQSDSRRGNGFFVLSSNQLLSYDSYPGDILLQAPLRELSCLCVSDIIALVGNHEKVIGLDPKLGTQVWSFPVKDPSCLRIPRSMKYCVLSTSDGDLRVYDLRSKEMKLRLKEHAGRINQLELFSDQTFALTCGKDHNLISYDLSVGRQLTCHRNPINGVTCMALRSDQSTVITGGGKNIVWYDLRVMDPVKVVQHSSEVVCMHSFEDDLESVDELLIGDSSGRATLFDLRREGVRQVSPYIHAGPVTCVARSKSHIYTGGTDNTVVLWSEVDDVVRNETNPVASIPLPLISIRS